MFVAALMIPCGSTICGVLMHSKKAIHRDLPGREWSHHRRWAKIMYWSECTKTQGNCRSRGCCAPIQHRFSVHRDIGSEWPHHKRYVKIIIGSECTKTQGNCRSRGCCAPIQHRFPVHWDIGSEWSHHKRYVKIDSAPIQHRFSVHWDIGSEWSHHKPWVKILIGSECTKTQRNCQSRE